MSFKIIGFACFVTSLIVSGGAVSNSQAEEPSARDKIPETIASLSPKRQEQPWRNDTRSASSSAPTWIPRTRPFEVHSSSGHHLATPAAVTSNSAASVSTSTQSSPLSSVAHLVYPNSHLSMSEAANTWSDTSFITSSLSLPILISEHALSTSTKPVPSEQHASVTRSTMPISSKTISVHFPQLTVIPSSYSSDLMEQTMFPIASASTLAQELSSQRTTSRLSTYSMPRFMPPHTPVLPASPGSASWSKSLHLTSALSSTAIPAHPTPQTSYHLPNSADGVTPSQSGFVTTLAVNTSNLLATSSVRQVDYSVSLSTTPALVTYMTTPLTSIGGLPVGSSTSAPLRDTSKVVQPVNTLTQEISSATVASDTPPYLSPSVVASSGTYRSTTPFNKTNPTSVGNDPTPSVPVPTVSSIFTFVLSTSSIDGPVLLLGPSSSWHNNTTSVTVTSSDMTLQQSSDSPTAHGGWNTTFTIIPSESATPLSGAEVPTGQQASFNSTVLYASNTSRASNWKTSTLPTPTLNSTNSDGATSITILLAPMTSSTVPTISTTHVNTSVTGPIKTVTVALPPPSSTTNSATSDPPTSPPLTVSQKAGVAIASTTGLLIAVVAAIYLARRYRMNKSRRSSLGSIYPKEAYLYDPPAGGSDHNGDVEDVLMSGGSSGMPPMVWNDFRASTAAVEYGRASSRNLLPQRFSNPGNPFRDPGDASQYSVEYNQSRIQTPTETEAAFAAAIKGYRGTSQGSSVTGNPATRHARKNSCPSAALESFSHNEPKSVSRRSVLSEITSMAYTTTARSPPHAPLLQSRVHQGFHSNHSLPRVRETMYTDSCRDPFEHDLLLKVDTFTETPDFATVYAPSTGSSLLIPATAPIRAQSRNPWASSMISTCLADPITPLNKRFEPSSPISPDATIVASECFSPIFGHRSSSTCFTPFQKQDEVTTSPISPSCGAVHIGWDEIKRYSAEKVVPSVASLSPPLGYCSPIQTKKKSLPQLRRKDPILTGLGEVRQSRSHLSLAP
ncbi:hypothetical protein HBH70_185880 [Parastagonospora nodorum]|nr:hypothetical protein HBI74_093920 [Parastagonospora nodorum]KAH5130597.1 hypothetical protein HBH70_185880 [Parastagonospora nodorum]KAH5405101.1 hypothetical protein HBI46_200450 [Parastagonospora nodorum]KAH6034237.1 hypothetical protein HBI54_206020 [Parastagonospora nodorum]